MSSTHANFDYYPSPKTAFSMRFILILCLVFKKNASMCKKYAEKFARMKNSIYLCSVIITQ